MNRFRAALACALLLPASSSIGAPAGDPASAARAGDPFQLSGSIVQGGFATGRVSPGTVRLTLNGETVPFDAQGRFIIGFDRDQPPTVSLTMQVGSDLLRGELNVAPRAWNIERINQDRPSTGPTPEYQKIRDGELARIVGARATDSASEGWKQHFILPAQGRFSGRFGSQRIYKGGVPAAFHTGLDIAPGAGKPVIAPADGVVVLAGPPMFSLEGNLVIIDHGMGLNSAFLHMASSLVKVGDKVHQGQQIGTVGATGRATGPHLHWSVKWRDARLDPILLVGNGG